MTIGADLTITTTDIEQLEDNLQKAMLSGDIDALNEYLDESLVAIDPFGRRLDKQQNLDFHRSNILKLDRIDRLDRSIRIMENAATVSWFGKLTGTYYGEGFSEKLAYSRVWSLRDGRWSLILIHATRITM
ncbi:nuclear transport factor 2 family protein [Phyllobacterium sp. SB3]|uniref:nuclear transport factor 2 family protein n=1 Tax=Phyllobacterium sp. SB3 TaxID=3156073 RepID=UPI0032AFBCB8